MLVLVFIVGLFAGFLLQSMLVVKNVKGQLRIHPDEDGPYLFVELDSTPDKLMKQKLVIFRVKNNTNSPN